MRKASPLAMPRLDPHQLEPYSLDSVELESETDLENLLCRGVARGDASGGRFERIQWEAARLSAVVWQRAHFADSIFRDCDMANARAREIFVSRVEIERCRALGLVAPESQWRDVVWRDCNLQMAQFRFSRWERVRFESCDLRGADFQNAEMGGAIFRHCDLREAQFSFAKLPNADFRTCETQDIVTEASALRGLIVSPLQAAQFAAILGLKVHWNDEGKAENGAAN